MAVKKKPGKWITLFCCEEKVCIAGIFSREMLKMARVEV